MTAPKPCRCLLLEAAPDLHAIVRDYVDTLPVDLRADAALYERRLSACRECRWLHSGTCALCGCYVEARAAKKPLACPDVPGRW